MIKQISALFLLFFLIINFTYSESNINLITSPENLIKFELSANKKDNKVILNFRLQIDDRIKNYVQVRFYEIYRNSSLIATTTNSFFVDENLQSGTYEYYATIKFTYDNNIYSKKSGNILITIESETTNSTTTQTTISPVLQESSSSINNLDTTATINISQISSTTTEQVSQSPMPVSTTTATTVTTNNTITPPNGITTPERIHRAPRLTPEISAQAKVKISGKSLISNKEVAEESKIFIKTEKEGILEVKTDKKGEFSIEIAPNQKVSIINVKEKKGEIFKSNIINLDLEDKELNLNVNLEKERKLLKPMQLKIETTKESKVALEDKTEIIIPSSTVTTTNIVNIEIEPTIDIPPVTNFTSLSNVYDIKIKDENNQEIKTLEKEIEIRIPYNEEEIKAKGLSEDQLTIGYFDETQQIWVPLEKFSIDKESNVVIGYTKHLTKFAIISFADLTPPLPPSNIKLTLIDSKKVKITWLNPKEDFKYTKIYRSLNKNTWGDLAFKEVTTTEVIDENVESGKTYYYLLRSVDYAGNESVNTEQVAITTFKFKRHLKKGMRGEDVKKLQEILVKEGVYPEKFISGYFGPSTYRAVIKFQEKYFDEILKPLKIKKGTGFVGPATLKKLNQLLNK
jgi:hypothetical protein